MSYAKPSNFTSFFRKTFRDVEKIEALKQMDAAKLQRIKSERSANRRRSDYKGLLRWEVTELEKRSRKLSKWIKGGLTNFECDLKANNKLLSDMKRLLAKITRNKRLMKKKAVLKKVPIVVPDDGDNNGSLSDFLNEANDIGTSFTITTDSGDSSKREVVVDETSSSNTVIEQEPDDDFGVLDANEPTLDLEFEDEKEIELDFELSDNDA